MPFQQQRGRGPAPRRTVLATLTVFFLCILAFVALSQPLAKSESAVKRLRVRSEEVPESQNDAPVTKRAAVRGDKYLIGVGKADITGPVVEVNLAGYANMDQVGSGLRQRLYARTFIIGEVGSTNRFVYVVLDTMAGDTAIRNGILEKVAALGSQYSVYGRTNVAITGTHSHSGPGGWFNYLLPQLTSLGFDKQGYQAIVDGAVLSIKRAHENLQEVSERRGGTSLY
jgi:neutral ceramidase